MPYKSCNILSMLDATFDVWLQPQLNCASMYLWGYLFCKQIEIEILTTFIVVFCVCTANFLNLLLFYFNFNLFLTKFVLVKTYIICLTATVIHGCFYKQLQLLMVEAQKCQKLNNCKVLDTVQTQIVSRLKQLRLKLTTQQSALLVAEY